MSGLAVRLSDSEIPPSPVVQATFDSTRGLLIYEREAKQPRKLRAVGGERWLALADHQSRLYRFEWHGLSHRFESRLTIPVDAETKYVQIVPAGTPREVFSVTYSKAVVQCHWTIGEDLRWLTEGLGIWYGVGEGMGLCSVVVGLG
ncbi:MAG: hypothetical protein ABI743_05955 [bacterium]